MDLINFETIKKMKAQDKAKAFDLIVEAVENNPDSAGQKVVDVLKWCTQWFR